MSDQVGNAEDRFSHNEAHVTVIYVAFFPCLHLIRVQIALNLVWVADWPPFEKEQCLCPLCNFSFEGRNLVLIVPVPIHCLLFTLDEKHAFCQSENKDADQLRGNRTANQRLCSRYIYSTIRNFNPLTILCGYAARFVSDLVGNTEDRFSHDAA